MLDLIGLILIVIGWSIQLVSRKKTIVPAFPLCYALGVLLLVVTGWQAGYIVSAGLNMLVVVLVFGVAIVSL